MAGNADWVIDADTNLKPSGGLMVTGGMNLIHKESQLLLSPE